MSNTYWPDVSSNQAGISFAGWEVACIKATEGDYYTNPDFARAVKNAEDNRAFPFAYHFLVQDHTVPQTERFLSVVPPGMPLMVDVETQGQTGSEPTLSTLVDFIDEVRKRGGRLYDVYLPEWYWSGVMGSPSLTPLKVWKCFLTSSNYTTYSSTGVGFQPYGGMTPEVWQFSDNAVVNGYHPVDMNGSPHTLAEVRSLLLTGGLPGPVAVNPVSGLKTSRVGWTSVSLVWDAQHLATSYTVHVFSGSTMIQSLTTTDASIRVGHLSPVHKYMFDVRAHPGHSLGHDAQITVRTR
jgi:hypothetical protein